LTPRGGDFPHIDPAGCTAQLSAYITSGAYIREVNASVDAAFAALGLSPDSAAAGTMASGGAGTPLSKGRRGSRTEVFVFDIDETALSNIVHLKDQGLFRGKREDWDTLVGAVSAPPLEPTLGFYKARVTEEESAGLAASITCYYL
jgi:hypothetical protein